MRMPDERFTCTPRATATFLLVGVLGIPVGGCGDGTTEPPGAGGTTTGLGGTGGSNAAASGGAPTGGSTAAMGSGGSSPSTTGGTSSSAGGSGGTPAASGGAGAGGASVAGRAGGGRPGRGGGSTAGGAPSTGGESNSAGSSAAGESSGGRGGATTVGGSGGSGNTGTCTASKATGTNVSGTGSHKVTVETNPGAGIAEGTIFRPSDLGGTEKYPIFVWAEGGCSQNGLSNSAAMAEIASHGYFVIADGTPNGSSSRAQTSDVVTMAKPLIAYLDWAIAENGKSCSAYYQSLDTTKTASNGFSCGGLMAEGTAGDPRLSTWGLNSSGMFSANQAFYKTVHTPVLIVLGGSGDVAYPNGERD
ncbi:MAG TPA: hypothetical protein VGQ57_00810, partial [Polyangiaceae bacterium]|nr:hypothetical protein [Polyangiaceae bacterium]